MKRINAINLAIVFHEIYERLAPKYGYETRKETRVFNASSPNGKLMIEVCRELQDYILTRQEKEEEESSPENCKIMRSNSEPRPMTEEEYKEWLMMYGKQKGGKQCG